MNLKDFGDLDLIPKAMSVEKLKIHCLGLSVFSEITITGFLVFPWKHAICVLIRSAQIFQLHVFLWRSITFWLTNILMELWSADSEMDAEILGWTSMAQLTARLTVNQEVGGSTLTRLAILLHRSFHYHSSMSRGPP